MAAADPAPPDPPDPPVIETPEVTISATRSERDVLDGTVRRDAILRSLGELNAHVQLEALPAEDRRG